LKIENYKLKIIQGICMVTAKLQNLKITARKVRLVADMIRRKPVVEAEAILRFTTKKTSLPLLKLLQSALANAKNAKIDTADLIITKIMVNEGAMQERVFPRSRGRADHIQKKTSHILIELGPDSNKEKAAIGAASSLKKTAAAKSGAKIKA
jgi:large subunit ribosomal protein L22